MSDTVIEIRDLSKLYRLGEVGTGTLSHDLNRWWARMRGKDDPYSLIGQVNRRDQQADTDYVWALKDINLEVARGEVLGIIGGNGAGKSTLLKLISRITSPTTGHIRAKGRIASLLEVGTGMHPEMTARENIYLNGAILGMRRHEITRKFDDIIDFAGCRMYVDTPVKRYSSGMRVRLGFAVAAFLEPEILIVDEVLAVGDAEFQKKCLGQLKKASRSGRTVLFVSHSMAAIHRLCPRVAVMESGHVAFDGDPDHAIAMYLDNRSASTSTPLRDRKDRGGDGTALMTDIEIVPRDSRGIGPRSPLTFTIKYESALSSLQAPRIIIGVYDISDASVYRFDSRVTGGLGASISGQGELVCDCDPLHCTGGTFTVNIALFAEGRMVDYVQHAVTFDVASEAYFQSAHTFTRDEVLFLVPHTWTATSC